jgi:arylsulfatase A-like enzyme
MNKILNAFLLIGALFFITACDDDPVIEEPTATETKPNILFIIADDMGLDASPGYNIGTVKPTMPHLQNLIDEGIIFNNFWATPTCTPTRSSIITGKYGFRTGVNQVGDVLPTSELSLQQYLKDNNSTYNDAVIGKWHLGSDASHPNDMGISHYAGVLSGGVSSYTNWSLTENGQTTNSTEYVTSKFSDLAIDWLDTQSEDKPWFLWLAYNAPHTPFHLPPSNLHSQTGLSGDQTDIDANPLPYYIAAMEAMDAEIGRVLSSLSESELENTIIIFIGDNGTPNQVAQEYNSSRVKGSVYKGGINVPMVIAGKGVSRLNQSEDALINAPDLFATIANIAGIDVTEINDSKSFKPLLTNDVMDSRDYIYSGVDKNSGEDYTIRNLTHKYILFENGGEALYNLNNNPFENPNLLKANQLPLNATNEAARDELVSKVQDIRN